VIEVFFKIVHNYCDLRALVKLNFHPFNTTRGNKFKLQKFNCHYNIRKYLFGSRVVNIRNSLPIPDYVVEADSVVFLYSRIVLINTGLINMLFMIQKEPTCLCLMLCYLKCGQRGFPAPVTSHYMGLVKLHFHIARGGQRYKHRAPRVQICSARYITTLSKEGLGSC